MKSKVLLLFAFILYGHAYAQRTIDMRNLWTRPQVHVLFQGYVLSFTIKDIDKALDLLYDTGDTTLGRSCGLDTGGNYNIELYPGTGKEYRSRLERIMEEGVGAFLLTAGHADIKDHKRKTVKAVIANIQTLPQGVDNAYILFYDPRNNVMLFSGRMAADMYKKDLGID